jgi:hypothetical protein
VITFYTIVKGFEGKFDRIQRNAIGSWLELGNDVQVVLFGEAEPGAATFAEVCDLEILSIDRNAAGVPFVNSVFSQIDSVAQHKIRCFINADIVILPGFLQAVQIVAEQFPRFLVSARRWDIGLREIIDFMPGWDDAIRQQVAERGELHSKRGVDVFCTRDVDWGNVPEFVVGRSSYDNWLVWRALRAGAAFVDVTPTVMVVHQNHGGPRSTEAEREKAHALFLSSVDVERKTGLQNAQYRLQKSYEIVEV